MSFGESRLTITDLPLNMDTEQVLLPLESDFVFSINLKQSKCWWHKDGSESSPGMHRYGCQCNNKGDSSFRTLKSRQMQQ